MQYKRENNEEEVYLAIGQASSQWKNRAVEYYRVRKWILRPVKGVRSEGALIPLYDENNGDSLANDIVISSGELYR